MKRVVLIFAGIIAAAIIFYALKINNFYQKIYTPISTKLTNNKPKSEKTQFSILLLGYAGSNHAGTYLTDTLIVMHFDSKKKKALMLSLPRDLWVKFPTKSGADFHAKINTIYETELFPADFPDLDTKIAGSKSDAELTKYIVGQITGFEIDNYIAIDFASFTKAIDILGGVDIKVARAFDDEKYPVEGKEDDPCDKKDSELEEALKIATQEPEIAFPCRYEKIHFDAGSQHLDGATALKFARSRQSAQDGGDFARARRQQQVLEAIRTKVFSVGFISKLPSLLEEMEKYIKTDISPEEIKRFSQELPSANGYSLTSLVLSDQNVLTTERSDNGQFILTPKDGMNEWKSVQLFIKNGFDVITPIPTKKSPF